jgi:hypothetical protein
MHESDTSASHATADDQIRSFSTEEHLVVYDPDNPDCWIQSDTTVDLAQ